MINANKMQEKEKEGNNRGAKEREKLYRHNRFSSEGIRRFRYFIYIYRNGKETKERGQWIEGKHKRIKI